MASTEFNPTLVKVVLEDKDMIIIECPLCSEDLTGQIFLCLGGHSICKACKEGSVECPTCKAKWSEGRNFMLEQIIQSSRYACSFKGDDGCEVVGNGESIKKHIKTCRFRPTACPYHRYAIGDKNYCTNTSLKLHNIREHLATLHKFKVHETQTMLISCLLTSSARYGEGGNVVHCSRLLTFDNKSFTFTLLSSKDKDRFFFIVLLLGPKEEEGLYRAKIVLQPGKKEMRKWDVPIQSAFCRTIIGITDEFIHFPSFTWKEIQKIMNVDGNEDTPISVSLKCTIKKSE